MGVLGPGSCHPREAGTHYAGRWDPQSRLCGSKMPGTARAWQGDIVNDVIRRDSMGLRTRGAPPGGSGFVEALAERPLQALGALPEAGLERPERFALPEELVG